MNIENVLKALALADSLMTAATNAYHAAVSVIGKAHAEGRDVTDAELDALRSQRSDALAKLHASVGQ